MRKGSFTLTAVLVGAVVVSVASGIRTLVLADDGTREVAVASGVDAGPTEPVTASGRDKGDSESRAGDGVAADHSTADETSPATMPAESDNGLAEANLQKAERDVDRDTAEDVERAVETALGSPDQVEPDEVETAIVTDLPEIAQGQLLAELQAQLTEYDSLGWQQEGVPTVEGIKLLKVDSQESANIMVVQACVDWSQVTYTDTNGKTLSPSATPRALNVFTLQRATSSDPWVPIARDFPVNPAC